MRLLADYWSSTAACFLWRIFGSFHDERTWNFAERLYTKVYVLMNEHPFIFQPGVWLGEGRVSLSMMKENELRFCTKWNVREIDDHAKIEAFQEIEISGLADRMENQFIFYDVTKKGFCIELENQALGAVVGQGLLHPEKISWEFRLGHLGFEGFEFYEKGEEPDMYLVHAEYMASDDFRTTIHGKIWKKQTESLKEKED